MPIAWVGRVQFMGLLIDANLQLKREMLNKKMANGTGRIQTTGSGAWHKNAILQKQKLN